jgi:hypothetical protein
MAGIVFWRHESPHFSGLKPFDVSRRISGKNRTSLYPIPPDDQNYSGVNTSNRIIEIQKGVNDRFGKRPGPICV